MTDMPTSGNPLNLTEGQAVDIGEQSFTKHIAFVSPHYGERLMLCYLSGCLAVITHWMIKTAGGKATFTILQELADLALDDELKKGKDNAVG